MIMNSLSSSLNRRLPKLVILATWLLFAITLGMDPTVLSGQIDFITAAWILAAASGLVGVGLTLRGWPQWWTVCVAAAILLVLTDILYMYDVFASGQDKTFEVAIHDLWKTLWHSLRSGAVAVAYRELIMPIIQLGIIGYFTWLILSARRKTH